jgi:hypothetical protein
MKLLEQNRGNISEHRNSIWGSKIPKSQKMKAKIGKWDYNLNSFFTAKKTLNRVSGQHTEKEKIFAMCTSEKGSTSKVYTEFQKSFVQLNKRTKDLSRHFSKEDI